MKFLATKFSKVSWWALWIGDPRNFHNSFFVKNYYLNLIYFQALQSAFFKNETKNFKKDASQLKIAWQLTLAKERREKNKKKSNNSFFTFIFLYRKTYILLENILEETWFILLHSYCRFSRGIFIFIGFVDAILRSKKLGILT